MKYEGERLRARLRSQTTAVTVIYPDGREVHNLSPAYAAGVAGDGAFTGYGKNGLVRTVVANGAPRRSFALPAHIAAAAAGIPRQRKATKNVQAPGAKEWKPQPTFANTGHASRVSTIHLMGAAQ